MREPAHYRVVGQSARLRALWLNVISDTAPIDLSYDLDHTHKRLSNPPHSVISHRSAHSRLANTGCSLEPELDVPRTHRAMPRQHSIITCTNLPPFEQNLGHSLRCESAADNEQAGRHSGNEHAGMIVIEDGHSTVQR